MVLHQVRQRRAAGDDLRGGASWSLAQATRALDVSNALGAESFLAIATARRRMRRAPLTAHDRRAFAS